MVIWMLLKSPLTKNNISQNKSVIWSYCKKNSTYTLGSRLFYCADVHFCKTEDEEKRGCDSSVGKNKTDHRFI